MLVLIAEAFDFHFGQKAPAGSTPTEAFRAGDGPKALGSPVFGPARRLSKSVIFGLRMGHFGPQGGAKNDVLLTSSTPKMRASLEATRRSLATVRGLAASWERTLDAVKLCHANAPFERAADRCNLPYLDRAALCAASTTERRPVKGGRAKRGRYNWR